MSAKRGPTLPSDVISYKRTALFTKENCPKGLLSKHNTKEGTWGLIHVEKGSLKYTVFGDNTHDWEDVRTLTPEGPPGVIEPEVWHKIKMLSDDTAFYVEFLAKSKESLRAPSFLDSFKHSPFTAKSTESNPTDRKQASAVLLGAAAVSAVAACMIFLLVRKRTSTS